MRKTLCSAAIATSLALGGGGATAMEIGLDNAYVGGGLNHNDLGAGYDTAIGFQFLGGYELTDLFGDLSARVPELFIAGEVGYMDSGSFNARWSLLKDQRASGLWTTGVGGYSFFDGFMVFGRAGLDFGDDDGTMVGGGVEYEIHDLFSVRGEYVIRNNIDSAQVNVIFHPAF